MDLLDCFVETAKRQQAHHCINLMSVCGIRVGREYSLQHCLSLGPLPLIYGSDRCEGKVCFDQCGFYGKGFPCSLLRFRKRVPSAHQTPKLELAQRIGDAEVCSSVGGVFGHCLLKVADRGVQSGFGLPVPKRATDQEVIEGTQVLRAGVAWKILLLTQYRNPE